MGVVHYPSKKNFQKWRVLYQEKHYAYFPKYQKAEAEALLAKLKAEGKQRKRRRVKPVAIGITLGEILDNHVAKSRCYKAPFKNLVLHGEKILAKEIDRVTDIDIDKLLHLVMKNTTRKRKDLKHEVDLINAALAVYAGTLGVSYAPKMATQTREKFKLGSTGELEVSLTPDQLSIVFNFFLDNYPLSEFFLLVTEFLFGDRVGEAFAYEQTNLHLEAGYIQKTGNFNVAMPGAEKSKRLKETKRGNVLTLNTAPKVWIEHVLLTAFFNDVLNFAKSYSDRWLFPRVLQPNSCNQYTIESEDQPIAYRTFSTHLAKTGFFSEQGMLTHKIRKTTKTLGEIEVKTPEVNPTEKLLRHKSKAVQDRYRDKALIARYDDLPARLFMKYVLPIYRPTDESILAATKMRSLDSVGR